MLEQAITAMPLAVVVVDLTGRIVLWTGAAEAVYGWTAAEAVGRLARELIVPLEARDDAAAIVAGLYRGETWSGTFHLQHRDGSRFEVHVMDAPVRDSTGEMVGVIGMSVDITASEAAKAAAHEAVRLSEEHFRQVFDQSPLGGVIVDVDLRILRTNAAWRPPWSWRRRRRRGRRHRRSGGPCRWPPIVRPR